MSTEKDVYHAEMLTLGHGLPIFEPDPAEAYDKVRVGDVGYVDEFGSFHRTFNVFKQRTDIINRQFGTPDDFIPLNSSFGVTHRRTPLQPGALHSKHVRVLGGGFNVSGSCIPANASITLTVSNREGAALIIRYPAYREDAVSGEPLGSYMLQNYRSWFEYIRHRLGRLINIQDIVLVTGCDLTADWAIAAFIERSTECMIEFKTGDSGLLTSGGLGFWGRWESSLSVPHRTGPVPVRPPEATSSATTIIAGTDATEVTAPTYNQCIFLRGFRVRERTLRAPKVIRAAAEPNDLDMDRDVDYPQTLAIFQHEHSDLEDSNGSSNGFDKTVFPSQENSLYDNLFDRIFQTTDSDVALVHDNDVSQFIRGMDTDSINESEWPNDNSDVKVYIDKKTAKKGIRTSNVQSYYTDLSRACRLVGRVVVKDPPIRSQLSRSNESTSERTYLEPTRKLRSKYFRSKSALPINRGACSYCQDQCVECVPTTINEDSCKCCSQMGLTCRMPPKSDHRQREQASGSEASMPMSDIGKWKTFATGPFAGRTVRAEIREVQKADLGRKCADPPTWSNLATRNNQGNIAPAPNIPEDGDGASSGTGRGKDKESTNNSLPAEVKEKGDTKAVRMDRRPLDPPPVVELKLYESVHHGTPRQYERGIPAEDVEIGGFICQVELSRVTIPPSPTDVALAERPSGGMGTAHFTSAAATGHRQPFAGAGGFGHGIAMGLVHTASSPYDQYSFACPPARLQSLFGTDDEDENALSPLDVGWESSASPNSPMSPYTYYRRALARPNPQHPTLNTHVPTLHTINSSSVGAPIDVDALLPPSEDKLTGVLFDESYGHACSILDLSGKPTIYFVFADLSIVLEGLFRPRYRFFDSFSLMEGSNEVPILAQCFGGAFAVYSSKEFPGLKASTPLTKHLSRWGIPVNIHETERRMRAPDGDGSGSSKNRVSSGTSVSSETSVWNWRSIVESDVCEQ